eukprot:1172867-Prymnesium_polylepis.1
MGITLHHGCWNAKHVWVSSESASSGNVILVFARGVAVSCSRATLHLRLIRIGRQLFGVALRNNLHLLGERHLSLRGRTHRAVAASGLTKQGVHTLEDASVLVMGMALHDGCVGKQGTSDVEKNSWGCATRALGRRRRRC